MDDKWTKLTEEMESLLAEANQDPEVANAKLPPNLYDNIWREIHAREAERAREKLCDEDKELLRLGQMYKKRHRMRKYLVLAAAVIAMLALGITSVGGPEKIFETLKRYTLGREQMSVNSEEGIERVGDVSEEDTYEEIDNKFGFYPVRLNYLPEGIEFVEAELSEEIQLIYMLYGAAENVNILYQIRPNYRESSWGKDIEDELLEEYDMVVKGVRIQCRKYLVEDNSERWMVGFEYENVSYSMILMHLEQGEVKKIVENLYFY